VTFLRADWTTGAPLISNELKRYGAIGVPFYVILKKNHQPIILPTLLTKSSLTDNLSN